MAYAAVVSLMQILEQLMLSNPFSIPHQNSLIGSLFSKACSLLAILEENFPAQSNGQSRINELETQIRDAVYEAEDIIESRLSTHSLRSGSESSGDDEIFTHKLQKLLRELDSIEKTRSTAMKTDLSIQRPDLIVPVPSSRFAPTKLVGLKDGLSRLKDKLIGESSRLNVVSVVGMGGIGKTTLVDEVYRDPSIRRFFPYRAWATVGPNHGARDVLVALLRSAARDASRFSQEPSDSQLTELMYKKLKGGRYLIALDGLSDAKTWDDLKNLFPNDDNGSRIMLTTRLRKVALHAGGAIRNIHQMRFLDNEESWDLLRDIVFEDKVCPLDLLKIGKTIAENCQGLPLTIVLVGTMLLGARKTPGYWKKVADSPISAINETNDVELTSAMQFMNDDNLPQHLKALFLYMGVFPLNHEIPVSKLVKLWVSEGFVKQSRSEAPEEVAEACLEELFDRSLVLVHKPRSIGGIKTCSVHSAVWHLCVNAAEKDKFFCSVSRYTEGGASPPITSTCRRLCIRKNILFVIQGVYDAIVSASNARSLLCNGRDHPYPLRVCVAFRLLRVLDVLTIRFYEFPLEILKLIQLRYLALTCNGCEIPASLSELWNLQVLIVRWHLRIKSSGAAPSYLPIEIWNMKYLRHLEFMGGDLRNPNGAALTDLLTLSKATGHSVTKSVLEGTPNLKKLGICIEVADVEAAPSCVFDHLALLSRMESFKCVVVNPSHGPQVIARPDSISNFPPTLKKLTLSGCGFPWEDMRIIARLPNLEVLKLRCYAFQGPGWELDEEDFSVLKFLLLEDLDLEHWTADGLILKRLERLIIRHCYKLKEIPVGADYIIYLQMVELVDCSPSVVDSGMRIYEMQRDLSNGEFQLSIDSSWKERSTKKPSPDFPDHTQL